MEEIILKTPSHPVFTPETGDRSFPTATERFQWQHHSVTFHLPFNWNFPSSMQISYSYSKATVLSVWLERLPTSSPCRMRCHIFRCPTRTFSSNPWLFWFTVWHAKTEEKMCDCSWFFSSLKHIKRHYEEEINIWRKKQSVCNKYRARSRRLICV